MDNVKNKPDIISFRLINGQMPPGESNHIGVVGIFINDREFLDIVREIESAHFSTGPNEYIYQTARELYLNLVPTDRMEKRQREYGTEILSCTCGFILDGSPTVFIEKDSRYVYWKALGHNIYNKSEYYYRLDYVFDLSQYEEALKALNSFAQNKEVY